MSGTIVKLETGIINARPRTVQDRKFRPEGCIGPSMTNFFVYMIGVILVAGALAYGASLMGLGTQWIAIMLVAIVGLGVMAAIVKTRQKEPS